jgi:hypothetical protein
MTRGDIAKLFSVIAAFDRRTIGEADIMAWHAALNDLDFIECRDAVIAHFRISDEWLTPARIREQIRLAKVRRRPPTIAEQDELEARRIARIDAIASVPRAIEVASEDRSDVPGAPGAVSGPAAGTSQSPLDHRERPNLAKSLGAVGRSL